MKESKKAARKAKIQQVAIELIDKNGFVKTTIAQIAESAELGTGTVYNYFKTKEEILFSIIFDRSLEYAKELDAILTDKDNCGITSVKSYIDIYLRSFSVYSKTVWRELTGAALLKNVPLFSLINKSDKIYLQKFSQLFSALKLNDVIKENRNSHAFMIMVYELMIFQIIKYISDENIQFTELRDNIYKNIDILLKDKQN